MSLYQSLEIDSLKVRNILTRTNDNSLIPENFTIFSRGDGTTFWSSGVTANQFTGISSAVSSLTSTVVGNNQFVLSTVGSTLAGVSTFVQNLSTYAAGVEYTDQVILLYSTVNMSTLAGVYTPLKSTAVISTLINRAIISTGFASNDADAALSSLIASSIVYTSTATSSLLKIYATQSTFMSTTVGALRAADSTIMESSIAYTNNNIAFVTNNLNQLTRDVSTGFALTNTYPGIISNSASTLSTSIGRGDINTLSTANAFTSLNLSTATTNLSTTFGRYVSTTAAAATSTTLSLVSSITSTNLFVLNEIYDISTSVAVDISTLNQNISTLITTGLIDTLYESFIQLEQYSYNIIVSTLSISNAILTSTTINFEYRYTSTLEYVTVSTFNYLVANAYLSSISTLVPQVLSTMDYYISSEVIYFNSTIDGEVLYFTSTISASILYFNSSLSSFVTDAGYTVSTFIAQGLSEQSELFSTTYELISTFESVANISSLITISSILGRQYETAPSIILNSVDNLSSITGVGGITDLNPITVGIAQLDVSRYNNFYILISDIRSDVYYGIIHTGSPADTNRQINVVIDVQSSYNNNFQTLDTGTLATWLSTPPIYNPVSYSLTTATPRIPTAETTPQLYISTFMGTYNLNFRLTNRAMLLQSVETYGYIYSKLSFTSAAVLPPPDVQVTSPGLFPTGASFRYRGGRMTVSWNTNDYNVPVGVNFLGIDTYGNTVSTWVGPFKASDLTATFTIPTQQRAPYVSYRTISLSVYPDNNQRTIAAPFAKQTLDPLVIVNPSLNSRIRVSNDTANPYYLAVAEIYLYNDLKQNLVSDPDYASYRTLVSTSSTPYNNDFAKLSKAAMDNNPATAFWGGQDQNTKDLTAFVQAQLTSLQPDYTSATLISSIVILPDLTFEEKGLYDMSMTLSNFSDPGVPDGLFYSTIKLPSSAVCAYSFNG
jgi:hypothetical protein